MVAVLLAACSRPEPAAEPVRAVRTTVVGAGVAVGLNEFSGEVRARVESRLGFRVGGKIVRRLVELGQPVRAGQVLAQLDAQDLRLGQDSARAGLVAAQANYDQSVADLKRFRELRSQGFISAAELERRETGLKAAEASLLQARAQSSVQGNQTSYANLEASAAGVITGVDAEAGQVVGPGTPVVRLAHDGPRDVVFSVPEDRATWVRALIGKPGALSIKPWGRTQSLPGTVREVTAAVDPVTRTFTVKADMGKADLTLGQTVAVQVEAERATGAIRIPLTALIEKSGQSSVWVLDSSAMTVRLQPVTVGNIGADTVVVSSGLKSGEEVVTAGVHVLSPGQHVRRYVVASAAVASSASSGAHHAGAQGSAR
ncbi:efflux RND transporter periplasmic adaptor subunit [Aquabacterium sp.]|uniref:efflux RND transporter periplasmic adaptor subunit n=1 Tax=Aquabacterium sp. TaxID=1872578 RepID=UPI0035AD91D3